MLYLDYLSYNNGLKRISVSEKLLFCGTGLMAAVTFAQPATLAAIILLMHITMLTARIPPGYMARLWLGPATFLAIGLITVLFNVSFSAFSAYYLLRLGPLYLGITADSLQTAQMLAMRSAAAVSCLFLLATTTPVMHIVALGARLKPLRLIMEITLLTYRFIFVILAVAGRIYTAQQSRLGYTDGRKTMSSLAALASNLGRTAFLTARDLNIALLSRNYTDRLVLRCPKQAVSMIRIAAIISIWITVIWASVLL